MVSTPVAIGNGTWDVKVVLGETPVQADGSAYFKVPARRPLYFQALDAHGHAVQTMRSWSTLQPGEVQSCVGCHESKNAAPPVAGGGGALAWRGGARDLEPFYGPPRGFSFPREIQPILDRHCIRCHDQRDQAPRRVRLGRAVAMEADPDWSRPPQRVEWIEAGPSVSEGEVGAGLEARPAFSLLGAVTLDPVAKRWWSDGYLNLTLAQPSSHEWDRGSFTGYPAGWMVNWIGSQSIPSPLPPYAAGAARSELFALLGRGHYGVGLTREELDKLACWIDLLVPYCGDYPEGNGWSGEEARKFAHFEEKRRRWEAEERGQAEAWQAHRAAGDAVRAER